MPDSTALRRRGLKATLPRLQILEIFQDARIRHLTAEEVYRRMFAQGHDVGLATVYRVLAQLHQAGLLKQARLDTDRAVYELDDGAHHDHLVCVVCGHVQEFHDDAIERLQERVARARGMDIVEHSHILYGRCTRIACEHRAAQESAGMS